MKLALALAVHEIDEAVFDRQTTDWLADLNLMHEAQQLATPSEQGIALPPGVRLTAD